MATTPDVSLPLDVLYYYIWQMRQKQAQSEARAKATADAKQSLQESGGGSGGKSADQGTGEFGPLGGDVKSALSGFNNARSVANAIGGLFGGIPGLGLIGPGAPFTGLSLASTIAGLLGATPGYDPSLGLASAADIQGVQDQQGTFAAQRAAEQAMADYGARVESFAGPIATESWGPMEIAGLPEYSNPGGVNPGGTEMGSTSANPGGTFGGVGPGQAPGDNRDTDASGGPTGGNSDTGGTSDSTGGSRGGEGTDRKAGGVFRASRPKTERITWGERGTAPGGKSGETAIFIPDRMQLPGLQQNEQAVRAALRRSLQDILTGRRRSHP
jgi:hypothetical protein